MNPVFCACGARIATTYALECNNCARRPEPARSVPAAPLAPLPAKERSRPDFFDRAACTGVDPEIFFPEQHERFAGQAAKDICASCAVREECLRYALDNCERFGIWGGLSPKQRQKLSGRRPGRAAAPCGTRAKYLNGCRCDACRAASSAYHAGRPRSRSVAS